MEICVNFRIFWTNLVFLIKKIKKYGALGDNFVIFYQKLKKKKKKKKPWGIWVTEHFKGSLGEKWAEKGGLKSLT